MRWNYWRVSAVSLMGVLAFIGGGMKGIFIPRMFYPFRMVEAGLMLAVIMLAIIAPSLMKKSDKQETGNYNWWKVTTVIMLVLFAIVTGTTGEVKWYTDQYFQYYYSVKYALLTFVGLAVGSTILQLPMLLDVWKVKKGDKA